jgi:hypothetical protein
MPANNVGHNLDKDGNVQVDFVWGNMPRQPNDVRTGTSASGTDIVTSTTTTDPVSGGSKRIVPGLDGHDAILGAWAGYPSFTSGVKDTNGFVQGDVGEFGVDFVNPSIWATATQASTTTASLTSVTIRANSPQALSTLRVGVPVFDTSGVNTYIKANTVVTSISGTTIGISNPPASALSGTNIVFGVDPVIVTTVSSASLGATAITVASASGIVAGQGVAATGIVAPGTEVLSVSGTTVNLTLPLVAAMSSTTVKFGNAATFVYTPYIQVPNVLGHNGSATGITAPAKSSYGIANLGAYSAQDGLRDAGYQNANIKVDATPQPNAAKAITKVNVTSAGTATIAAVAVISTATASTFFPAGTKVTIGSGTGIPANVVGTWVVTASGDTTLTIAGPLSTSATPWSVADSGTITPAASLNGVESTVFSQTVAAGADSITGTADITIKLYTTAS